MQQGKHFYHVYTQKYRRLRYSLLYSRLRCLLRVKTPRFGDLFLFGLVWQYLPIRTNIIKVPSKSWQLTCSNNMVLILPWCIGKGEIISKGLLVSSNSPKQQTKSDLLLRQIRSFLFWENSRTPKISKLSNL